ncbi:hypothetical protein GF338_09805 [candidate division WOR-3 bacterium]|nr:hypothetical protein [candidate division WOR-3 bacterium]
MRGYALSAFAVYLVLIGCNKEQGFNYSEYREDPVIIKQQDRSPSEFPGILSLELNKDTFALAEPFLVIASITNNSNIDFIIKGLV